jgi:hypothetical protein
MKVIPLVQPTEPKISISSMQNPMQLSDPIFAVGMMISNCLPFATFSTHFSLLKLLYTPFVMLAFTGMSLLGFCVLVLETALKGLGNIALSPFVQKCHCKTGINFLFLRTPVSIVKCINKLIFLLLCTLFSPLASFAAIALYIISWLSIKKTKN